MGWAGAGVLLGGPESRLAGATAAHLHTFGPEPRNVEVLVRRGWQGIVERCRQCRAVPQHLLGEWMP